MIELRFEPRFTLCLLFEWFQELRIIVVPEGHASGLGFLSVRKLNDFKKTKCHLNNILLRAKLPLPKWLSKFQGGRLQEKMLRLQALEEHVVDAAEPTRMQVTPCSAPNMCLDVLPSQATMKQTCKLSAFYWWKPQA